MRILLAVLALVPSFLVPQPALSRGGTSRVVEFALIGLGVGALSRLDDRACETFGEAVAGGAATALVGGVAGGLTGAILGSDGGIAGVAVGTGVGAFAGRVAVGTLLGSATGAAGEGAASIASSPADLDAAFERDACLIVRGSAVVRAPLLARYAEIAGERCGFDTLGEPDDAEWDRIVGCANNGQPESRELVQQLIGLNLATCRAIEVHARAIERRRLASLGPGESVMPRPPVECDDSAADAWAVYLDGRR